MIAPRNQSLSYLFIFYFLAVLFIVASMAGCNSSSVFLTDPALSPSVSPTGPVPVSSGILFRLLYPGAKTVSITGTFNSWNYTALSEISPGHWSIIIPLPKGRYQYLFVIDQKKWIPDPAAEMTIDDGFGHKNSLLVVE